MENNPIPGILMDAAKELFGLPVMMCPWCGSKQLPVMTAEHLHLANFQYGNRSDPQHVARNPAMCPDCYGVGGFEDWARAQE